MLEKINQIQELLNVPNADTDTETAIANMKILNLLVDLRAEAEQLILSVVVRRCCDETRKVNQFLKRPSKYCMTCSKELK